MGQFTKEELTKLHKITLLEEQKSKITLKLKLLNENAAEINEKLIDFDIPEWAMPALINGDYSGLENEDEKKLKNFIKNVSSEHGNAYFLLWDIDDKDNLGFKWHNDVDNLGSNVYRLYIMPSHELNEAKDKVELTFPSIFSGFVFLN